MKKQALITIAIASLSLNAHALCVNQDGSLDDASVSPSTVAVDTLPACERSAAPTQEAASPSEPAKADVLAKPFAASAN